MATEELSRCPGIPPGEPMLKDGDVRGIFALKRRGGPSRRSPGSWGSLPITVRYLAAAGRGLPHRRQGRRPILKEVLPWVRKRFMEEVRNSDVLRLELAEQGRTDQPSDAGAVHRRVAVGDPGPGAGHPALSRSSLAGNSRWTSGNAGWRWAGFGSRYSCS